VEVLPGVVVVVDVLVADTDEFEEVSEVVPGLELSVGGVFFNGLPGDVPCDDAMVLVDVVDGGITLVDLPWPENLIGVVVVGVVVFVLVAVFVVVVGALVVVVGVV